MPPQGVTIMRLERLADERERTAEKREDLLRTAEEEQRDLSEFEEQQITKYREQEDNLEREIVLLAADAERTKSSTDVSRIVREDDDATDRRWATPNQHTPVYRTFAEYARDEIILKYDQIALLAAGSQNQNIPVVREQAQERIQRTLQNTLSSNIAGLVPPAHMAQIMDIINGSRPVVNSARSVPLDRGQLTYPRITGRPEVLLQSAEKTEAGTARMSVTLDTLTAETYLGGGDLSWQAINWSTPDALQLWFDLAAEAYARATESAACEVLEGTAIGTVGTASGRLGTAGTENFAAWRAAAFAGIASIYSTTSGRAQTDTLYLSAGRFFQLAALGTDQTLQISTVGNLDVGSMTGTWSGLRVVGSYGFDQDTAIVGDSSAFLVAETPNAPVQMRVVEPSIAGMEVGVVGAFKAVIFDPQRFLHLGTHL
jgi:HK97 family phage major capsid protein